MEKNHHTAITALCLSLGLAGCSAPTVNLSTPKPITVDINVKLDVYQYAAKSSAGTGTGTGTVTVAKAGPTPEAADDAQARRHNRMADIQSFKNSLLVGEGADGLLAIVKDTPGSAGDYMRKTVQEENADRTELMKKQADKDKVSLAVVEKQQAALWRERSFKSEWIQEPQPDGSLKWVQKS